MLAKEILLMFQTQAGTLQEKKGVLEFWHFVTLWMNLEEILSEINQVHKEKFYGISFTCGKSAKKDLS